MTVVAGIDVGNATTEVVAVRLRPGGLDVLGADCLPTRGKKGSTESLKGAAALVRRLERSLGAKVEAGIVAPLRAVETSTVALPEIRPGTGRLRIVVAAVSTPGGRGACIGPPVRLEALAELTRERSCPQRPHNPVVVLVPAGLGYRPAAERLRYLRDIGWPIGAVLVPGDEGVLISNRLGADIPVVDLVDVDTLANSSMVGVEVRDPGQPVSMLSDPVALAARLGLHASEIDDATAVARMLLDTSNAVIALDQVASAGLRHDDAWLEIEGNTGLLVDLAPRLADWPPGTVTGFTPPGSTTNRRVADLWAVDLGAVADLAGQRKGSLSSRSFVIAALETLRTSDSPASHMSDLLETPVLRAPSESAAARAGALTTPGAVADALVIDIGGGTIDVIAPDRELVAAGAGELLTVAVAVTLGLPMAAADWVKRGPAIRVDSGGRFEAEDGTRGFLERAAPPAATGMLAVTGPAGFLPFDRRHSPSEWRALRLRLKEAVLATNLKRALAVIGESPRQILVVGGPAGDEELLGVLARSMPDDVAIGRGSVGSAFGWTGHSSVKLGHRYAAALGLAMSFGNAGL